MVKVENLKTENMACYNWKYLYTITKQSFSPLSISIEHKDGSVSEEVMSYFFLKV